LKQLRTFYPGVQSNHFDEFGIASADLSKCFHLLNWNTTHAAHLKQWPVLHSGQKTERQ